MLYLNHSPGPPLSEFVDSLWILTGAQTPRKERILPSGTSELVVNLRENEMRIHHPAQPESCKRFSGAILSGTYSRIFVCDARQHESLIGVHFRPGGASAFLGAAASELAETHADLADLWGQAAGAMRERLCESPTTQERFRLMEEFLMARLQRRPPKRHPAVAVALRLFGATGSDVSVRDVVRATGLSERRFIQVFKAQVGVTPKLFCRLLRFQRARALAQQMRVDWPELASICGYYDQSHLIHDFRQFSGSSPTQYLHEIQVGPWLKDSHAPLPEQVSFFQYRSSLEVRG